jgi:glycosyltransferase involved in cell wall biosynthesis
MVKPPLVSIGLPVYNGERLMRRALNSVLAQDYENFELIISDNASTDGTQPLCEEFRRRDPRIRYVRQTVNRGAAANFQAVLEQARGEFFMWLGDDDWLDPGYVAECVRVLVEQPDYQLVCGGGRYYQGDKFCFEEKAINLPQGCGKERVLSYYRQVGMNGMLYGVMRREVLSGLELRNTIGGDWLLMARMAFLGKVRTLENVFINRSLGGASRDLETLVAHHGLPAFVAKNPHLLIAFLIFRDIAWKCPIYESLGRRQRISLASSSASSVIRRYKVAVWPERTIERLKHPLRPFNNLRAKLILRTRLKRGFQSVRRKVL